MPFFSFAFFAQDLKSQDVFDGAFHIVVESSEDDHSGNTLREAIEFYNSNRLPGIITFKEDFPDVIVLEEEIKINVSLLIQGPEKGLTIKVKNELPEEPGSGTGSNQPVSDYRLFKIEPPLAPARSYDSPIEVRFHNLNLIGGDVEDEDGGAIHYQAYQIEEGNKLVLENVSFSKSKAHYGGAVYIDGYIDLEISNSIGKNNYSEKGGAVYFTGSSLAITNSVFEGNRAYPSDLYSYDEVVGGALFIFPLEEEHNIIIEDTEFLDNRALSGGAIGYNSHGEHSFKIVNTKFIHNKAVYYGGGIYIPFSEADIRIEACEFMHNKLCHWIDPDPDPDHSLHGFYEGGAIMIKAYSLDKPVKIHQCRFEGNGIDVVVDDFEQQGDYPPQVNGGALSLDAFAFITHTTFKENYIHAMVKHLISGGGAIFIKSNDFSTLIKECDFISNYVKLSGPNIQNSGGGAILSTVLPQHLRIMVERSTFSDNYVFIDSFDDQRVPSLNGGGACYIASTFILSESTLEGNYVKVTGDDEENMNPSGGGAIILGGHGEQSRIVNTTIANNRLENPLSEGAGVCGNEYASFNISNSIILGNYKGSNPTGSNIEFQDIYTITPEDFTMLYSVYGVYQPDVEDNEEEERKLLHNQVSDVQDVFRAEWRWLNERYVLVNIETGQPVLEGRVMKISAEGAAATAGTLTAFCFLRTRKKYFRTVSLSVIERALINGEKLWMKNG